MRYKNFEELKQKVAGKEKKSRLAVVAAHDPNTLRAVMQAAADGLVFPILIGDKAIIEEYLAKSPYQDTQREIKDLKNPDEAMAAAVELVHSQKAQSLMKGMIKTEAFMGAMVKRENQLRCGKQISMLSFRQVPNYHKLLALTDTGICPYPTLAQKKNIIENAVAAMTAMGIHMPKVAVLAADETVNPKMPESCDAAELRRMNRQGELKDCLVEGPISIDMALSKKAAEMKSYVSQVAGDADLLLFPNLVSANVTAKMMGFLTRAPVGVLILGTKVPAIVTSRSALVETKYLSITLGAANKAR